MQSADRRLVESVAPISTPVTAVAVESLTARFTRVVLHGEGLAGYREPLPGDAFRLFVPPPGHERAVMASFSDDGFPYWPDDVPRPTLRTYAVRASDAETARLTLDAAVWSPGGWVDRVAVGDRFHVYGMRHGFVQPDGADRVILIGDTGALPDMAAVLESLPDGLPATVVAEAPSPDEQQLLPRRPATSVHWTVGTISAGDGSPLERLAREHLAGEGAPAVRVTTEATVARRLRSFLRDQLGIDRRLVRTIAFWRAGLTSDERDAQLLPEFQAAADAGLDLRDLDVLEDLDLQVPAEQ
jgi:NADPH-dependent ferric siderophore reductase